jgi:hypothetical protein
MRGADIRCADIRCAAMRGAGDARSRAADGNE